MIAVIDYGMGNLRSIGKALERVGANVIVTNNPQRILDAEKIVLPGVGAFKDAMKNLEEMNLIPPILKSIKDGKPFLGICLGFQLLMTESEEFGIYKGFDIIKGKVVHFPSMNNGNKDSYPLKIPHMGWNTIHIEKGMPLLEDIEDNSFFYFVHSYYVVPDDKKVIAATTDYGITFTSGVEKDNIFAFQFHPEKSQEKGLKILKKFLGIK